MLTNKMRRKAVRAAIEHVSIQLINISAQTVGPYAIFKRKGFAAIAFAIAMRLLSANVFLYANNLQRRDRFYSKLLLALSKVRRHYLRGT